MVVQFRERGLMRLRSKLSPLIATMSLSESALVVQCGGRQGEPKERRREGLERDIFGDDRKGLKLQPWRFKWQGCLFQQIFWRSSSFLRNVANNQFNGWIPQTIISIPNFIYDGNSFDNGPAPPLPPYTPPLGRSATNRIYSGSHAPSTHNSNGGSSNSDKGNLNL
ncbi:uncharacterized protein LOC115976860 isoform X2 [Quercus lobata]|uniref:uncharacterized protein LOC115976860 isoform X2 n=1 Tax=Quercus lobata TaxID=97700 RepID=UPI001246D060|nr:uncharacterized protein LOC115976860 isoform X2 [Quercus lobata]